MLCRNSLTGPKRCWPIQQAQCDGMHGGEHRATDCDRAAGHRIISPGASGLTRRLRNRKNRTPVEAMAWRLRTPQGKQLYGLRKQTPERAFGTIKSVMSFRQFPAARARLRPRRVEPRQHGRENQSDACAQPRLSASMLAWIAARCLDTTSGRPQS